MKRARSHRLHPEAGMNLIELAIVLGVVAVVVGAVWLVAGVVYENVRQYRTIQGMQSMVQNIRQLYTRISIFPASAIGNNLTQTLDRQFAFPSDMRVTPGTNETTADGRINHAWSTNSSGTIDVWVRSTNTFGVRFVQVPRKACISVATKLTGGEVSNLSSFRIGSTTYQPNELPLDLVTATAQCTSDNGNELEWRFGLRG